MSFVVTSSVFWILDYDNFFLWLGDLSVSDEHHVLLYFLCSLHSTWGMQSGSGVQMMLVLEPAHLFLVGAAS